MALVFRVELLLRAQRSTLTGAVVDCLANAEHVVNVVNWGNKKSYPESWFGFDLRIFSEDQVCGRATR